PIRRTAARPLRRPGCNRRDSEVARALHASAIARHAGLFAMHTATATATTTARTRAGDGSSDRFRPSITVGRTPRCEAATGNQCQRSEAALAKHARIRGRARLRVNQAQFEEPSFRPPLARERVEHRPDGLVCITLKRAFADGTVAIEMDPLSLLCRLAATVPQALGHGHRAREHRSLPRRPR